MVGILTLAGVVFLSNRTDKSADGVPNITDRGGYVDAVKEAEQLSKDLLIAADQGKELSPDDLTKIAKCAKIFDGIIKYQPQYVQPYFSAGRCYELVGQKQVAKERFEQAIRNLGFENTEQGRVVAMESNYRLSQLLNESGEQAAALPYIQTALKEITEVLKDPAQKPAQDQLHGIYWVGLAKIQVQQKKISEAKQSLDKALTISPGQPGAIALKKFLESEAK